jgi:hypothetical protein
VRSLDLALVMEIFWVVVERWRRWRRVEDILEVEGRETKGQCVRVECV